MTDLATPCLVGPTASGKTEVAIHLARATGGEVIACDAFTVYAGMGVLTAAPRAPPDVPHHLVGVRPPSEPWSAAVFAAECDRLVDEIRARGRVPWIVGGTALYLRGWLKGFGARVPRDDPWREEARRMARERGAAHLHALLAAADPARAADLHANDLTRVVRALEIVRATGRPASAQRGEWAGPDRRPAVVFALRREAEDLDERIRRRARALFEEGVVGEVAALLRAGDISPEAGKALGLEAIRRLLAGRGRRGGGPGGDRPPDAPVREEADDLLRLLRGRLLGGRPARRGRRGDRGPDPRPPPASGPGHVGVAGPGRGHPLAEAPGHARGRGDPRVLAELRDPAVEPLLAPDGHLEEPRAVRALR